MKSLRVTIARLESNQVAESLALLS
ncbi:Protein of unknown function [Leuconostoc citreum LBAE C10]|nr:Protein of unknown function [Leuconostoc citreum LBAE C10]